MFKTQCLKLVSTALMLVFTLITSGCGTTTVYRATPEDTRDLSPLQARKLLMTAGKTIAGCHTPIKSGAVTHEKFSATCAGPFRFAEYPELVAMMYVADPVEGSHVDKTCINSKEVAIHRGSGEGRWHAGECMFQSSGANVAAGRDFVRAWYVWSRTSAAFYRAQEASFESEASKYRNAAVKPQLPEEAVKFKVKAELAVREKRFDDATNLYEQALDIAPWWPTGHYNRGLILGEMGDKEEAVVELKRYLKVDPDASNARAVQLKIYEWESTK